MVKQQICGMEELAGQTQALAADTPSVDGVSTHGVTDRSEVRADLVGTAGHQSDP
jgi:hypothetical protein